MAARKWDKYIINACETDPPKGHPKGTTPGTEMFYITDDVIKGAFMFCGTWLTSAPEAKPENMKQHTHDQDEYIGFVGCDYNNPLELGAEIEFWYEDDKYIIDKSCVIFIPKLVRHAPMVYLKVDKPFFIFSTIPDPKHSTNVIEDPNWSRT